jgi:hypothetical protein
MSDQAPPIDVDRPTQRPPIGAWKSHRPAVIAPLRWLLLVVILVGMATWLTVTPRPASASHFVEDLGNGKVHTYEVGTPHEVAVFRGVIGGDTGGTQSVTWCTSFASCHRVALDELQLFLEQISAADAPTTPENGPSDSSSDVVRQVIERFSAGPAPRAGHVNQWAGKISLPCAVAWLIALWVLITGPQPRHATKWAAFWLLGLAGGLGLLWILVREAPWSRRTAAEPEPPPGPWPARWTGGWTFLVVALATGVLRQLPSMLTDVLP